MAQSTVGANADRITDFSHAQGDKIDLAGIDADSGTSGNQAFVFIGSNAFSGDARQLQYLDGTVAGDLNGDGLADFRIHIAGDPVLGAVDFIL